MVKFTSEYIKLKNKALILAGVSLFVSMAGALPEKIAIIGLDFTANKEITGWFLFVITLIAFIRFMVLAAFTFIRRLQPKWINYRTRNLRGKVLGYSEEDIYAENQESAMVDDYLSLEERRNSPSINDELDDIKKEKNILSSRFYATLLTSYGYWVFLVDFIVPATFSIFSLYGLYLFLTIGQVISFNFIPVL